MRTKTVLPSFKKGIKLVNKNSGIFWVALVLSFVPKFQDFLVKLIVLGGKNPRLIILLNRMSLISAFLFGLASTGYLGVGIRFIDEAITGKPIWRNFFKYFNAYSLKILALFLAATFLWLIWAAMAYWITSDPSDSFKSASVLGVVLAPFTLFSPIILVLEDFGIKRTIERTVNFLLQNKEGAFTFVVAQLVLGYLPTIISKLYLLVARPIHPFAASFLTILWTFPKIYIEWIILSGAVVYYRFDIKKRSSKPTLKASF
jgi:hypothetical protein